jgi:hypothetical protein
MEMLLIGYGYIKAACVVPGWLICTDLQRSSNIECSLTQIIKRYRTRGGYGKAVYLHGVAAAGDIDGIGIG